MTEQVRKPDRRRDSLLAHCIARTIIAESGGEEAAMRALQKGDTGKFSQWQALKATVKATQKASRVAAFVVCWALAMKDEGVDEYSITEYQRYWNESERQAYRVQNEFRELWPEYETPNELARLIVRHLDAKARARDVASLPTSIFITA